MIDLLNNCSFDLTKIQKLYIGSTISTGGTISFPIEYNTVQNSSDSIVQYDSWIGDNIIIGGQEIVLEEVLFTGENIKFTEELIIDNLGKNYVKTIEFNISNIDLNQVNSLEELTDIPNAVLMICIMVDENQEIFICGYDNPVTLETIESVLGEDNIMNITLSSTSKSRTRNVALPTPPAPSPSVTPTVTPTITPSITVSPSITPSVTITPSITPSVTITPSITPSVTITPTPSPSYIPRPFITEWTVSGDTTARTITLPLHVSGGTFNAIVDWGDGSSTSTITGSTDSNRIHTYSSNGAYQVKISGECPGWSMTNYYGIDQCTDIIYWGDSSVFGGFSYLVEGFKSSRIKSLGTGKILSKSNLVSLEGLFRNCGLLTTVPSGLFDNCIYVNSNSHYRLFDTCTHITSIPSGLFDTQILADSFALLIVNGYVLTSIPTDLFRYNTGVTSFSYAFHLCEDVTSIPTDLFRYNINVTDFSFVFSETNITSIPLDFFRYNTGVTSFRSAFSSSNLSSTPNDLFKYNINTIDFGGALAQNFNLQINPWTFYSSSGETSTRFLNQSIDFINCFLRNGFTGTQGMAPDLWNCNFGTGTPTKTGCWKGVGNSLTSISNYNDIPTAWKT